MPTKTFEIPLNSRDNWIHRYSVTSLDYRNAINRNHKDGENLEIPSTRLRDTKFQDIRNSRYIQILDYPEDEKVFQTDLCVPDMIIGDTILLKIWITRFCKFYKIKFYLQRMKISWKEFRQTIKQQHRELRVETPTLHTLDALKH